MPARNSLKQYQENSYYHLYNRGVEKRLVFLDEQDYSVFLSYLKEYLLPKNTQELSEKLANPNTPYKEKDKIIKLLRLNNFADEITLLAYCLMPNHFHFLIKQKGAQGIDVFMNSLGTRYTMYFNRKYKRVGSLWQAVYKAVLINNDEQLLHLSRYIHLNPVTAGLVNNAAQWKNSSYAEYITPDKISHPLCDFRNYINEDPSRYRAFVDDHAGYQRELAKIKKLAME